MNKNLLKAQIALKGKTLNEIAEALGISRSALYRKINGKSEFTRKEICKIIDLLGIELKTAMNIFFNENVSYKTHKQTA
jgi:transcriptional regulator with XRE-family HTH domain